jgi:selenium-binding protein 1
MRPDPTFYPSPKLAMEAPPEEFAYTALLSGDSSKPDALAVIDVKRGSPTYSKVVHTVTMPYKGDEFHHFGWNCLLFGPVAAHRSRLPRAALSDHSRHPFIACLCRGHQAPSNASQDP